MKRFGAGVGISILALVLFAAGEAPQTLHFPLHGFSIAPLEGAAAGNALITTMYLPASDGFAPNVNVLIQKPVASIDDYIAISKKDIAQSGLKLLRSEKLDNSTSLFEYTGELKSTANAGRLHWYTRASWRNSELVLVTAAATELQWVKVGAQLKTCVDSFQLDPAP